MKRSIAAQLSKASPKPARNVPSVSSALEETVEEIVHEIETGGREISSTEIGEKVLEKLRELDEVAYLRYASVHHRFENVDRFVEEMQALARRIKPNALAARTLRRAGKTWSRLKKNFPISAPTPGSSSSSIATGCTARLRQAADRAGYPSWWLTDHVTESITFYLRLRNDEPVVAFSQLSQTVRYVLKVIGYKEIVPHFRPTPPPISISLFEIARSRRRRLRAGVFRSSGKTRRRARRHGRDQLALFRAAAGDQTSPRRENLDARLRRAARRSRLFHSRKIDQRLRKLPELSLLDPMTIFEKIVAREIPAKIVFEDDEVLAFHDVDPKAPVHVLIIPKRVIPRLAEAQESDAPLLGKLISAATKVARDLGIEESGYRVVINSGPDAGESVPHLHVHLLGSVR